VSAPHHVTEGEVIEAIGALHAFDIEALGEDIIEALGETIEALWAEVEHLRRQRDELQTSNTALLLRARKAEGCGQVLTVSGGGAFGFSFPCANCGSASGAPCRVNCPGPRVSARVWRVLRCTQPQHSGPHTYEEETPCSSTS